METIDITKILPERTPEGYPFIFEKPANGKVKITYIPPAGRPKPVVMNRHIPPCELFFEGLGLWTGDGHKTHTFGFTNCEPALMRKFLEFSDFLGIDENIYGWRILTPKLPADSEKEVQISIFADRIGLSKKRFKCFSLAPNRNFVCIHLSTVSKVLTCVVWAIFENAHPLILSDPRWAAAYLRGVVAADGTVHLRKDFATVKEIGIATTNTEFQKLFMGALKVLGIRSRCNRRGVYIEALDGFEKAKAWRILNLHPAKQAKFNAAMENFWQARGRTKYMVLRMLARYKELMTRRFYSKFNVNERFVRRVLHQLSIGGYIESPSSEGRMCTWRLTQKGRTLLQEYEWVARIRLGNLWSIVEGKNGNLQKISR